MLDSKQLKIIYWVLLAFRDYYVPGECEETPMGMMQEGIDDYLQGFDIQGGRYRVADLKEALVCAYQSDIELWWRFNCYTFNAKPPLHKAQEEDEESVQRACVFFWVEYFGLGKEFLDREQLAEYRDKYHPEMLKLLVKCCVWDVLFPGETLPGYTVPTSADTSSFDYTA
ncbi:hypothetical protein [Pseudoalteromonas piscicida]|uniref:Uncharacterized protein n=1 Tax=Pseudoalteromonas piscicida TaxID=43662 RepID=A0A2A5JL91_PSEO7|nr:hypothetical protein [Pseudoalteromonas piscicida]PCK30198.1 hypothetical protein CEX98_18770 [Pseudoalteromonas piscicida]